MPIPLICSRKSRALSTSGFGLWKPTPRPANDPRVKCMSAITTTKSVRGNGSTALPAGTPAPDFALKSTPDQTVRLSEFRGQPLVLVFYPADWSPVCGDQVSLYNEMLAEFQELGAEVVGISVDGPWWHAAFSRDRRLHFPLLADFEPKGEVAKLYGAYRPSD